MQLSLDRQLIEIREEFYEEAIAYGKHRSPIEDKIALNHINALLDAASVITVELCYEESKGRE